MSLNLKSKETHREWNYNDFRFAEGTQSFGISMPRTDDCPAPIHFKNHIVRRLKSHHRFKIEYLVEKKNLLTTLRFSISVESLNLSQAINFRNVLQLLKS